MTVLVVYTAIFGDINDQLRPPAPQSDCVRCVAFVDREMPAVYGWELRPPAFDEPKKDPRRLARRHKCLPHLLFPEASASLWMDGCLALKRDAAEILKSHLEQLVTFRHMQRNCVYQETEACVQLRKDRVEVLRRVAAKYRTEGYPHNNGLAETTAVLRRHTPQVAEFNEQWWAAIRDGSVRDQMSFDYICWKLGMRYGHLHGCRIKSGYFDWRSHR